MAVWMGADRTAAAAGQGSFMTLHDVLFHMMDIRAAEVLLGHCPGCYVLHQGQQAPFHI